ncbi:uncharacterized protein LOC131680128 [Topomyia yanbarensis]|uniref:uncharacterized protein LOC131680128 n=1 Tax=Topomyia yanbarensis TaxID=2498891 RepID=UPI00273AEA62|nr:uncharacterized protein LOC131680128 [Topomyia yanbarensis]
MLVETVDGHIENLKFLGQAFTGISEHMVVFLIARALDDETKKMWESTVEKGELPKYETTIAFLKNRISVLERCQTSIDISQPKQRMQIRQSSSQLAKQPPKKANAATAAQSADPHCVFCGGNHFSFKCSEFNGLSVSDRLAKVKEKNVCFNCLRRGHHVTDCSSKKTCSKCQRKHHTLLHSEEGPQQPKFSKADEISNSSSESSVHVPVTASIQSTTSGVPVNTAHSRVPEKPSIHVFLLTALVNVLDRDQQPHPCRVLLDCGSQVSFITQSMAIALNMPTDELGWLVSGNYIESLHSGIVLQSLTVRSDPLEELVQIFWEVEGVCPECIVTTEGEKCEQHFLATHRRDSTGRYVVQLPLKDSMVRLSDSRSMALRRFFLLESKLSRHPDLKLKYDAFMDEYETLQHCKEIQESNDPPDLVKWYLPHHAVLRPSNSTTQCRVVFDASAKVSGSSLNDAMMVGPTVQADFLSIILQFRKFRYFLSADIAKMYRQIIVDPCHSPMQRIFWRKSPNERLRVLELTTVTYGTASAPFLATRALLQLARDEREKYPLAARVIEESFYVDNALFGSNDFQQAINIQAELIQLLQSGVVNSGTNNKKIGQQQQQQQQQQASTSISTESPCTIVHKRVCSASSGLIQAAPADERMPEGRKQIFSQLQCMPAAATGGVSATT